MQVTQSHYFGNGIAHFVRRINKYISMPGSGCSSHCQCARRNIPSERTICTCLLPGFTPKPRNLANARKNILPVSAGCRAARVAGCQQSLMTQPTEIQ